MIATLLISIAIGIIAPLMMINKLFSSAAALTHAAFGGVGIAMYFALPVFICTLGFSACMAFIMAYFSWEQSSSSQSLSGVLWSFGMAFGILLIDLSPGYHPSVESFLFGDILAINKADLFIMAISCLIFIIITLCFYNQFELLSFDRELARLRGFKKLYYVLILMLCLCIAIAMKLLGLILIIALLAIPVLIAKNYAKSLIELMLYCAFFTFLFCFIGLMISFYLNTLSAASIVMVACAGLIILRLKKE